jgi:SAM-dependent methyltransferase
MTGSSPSTPAPNFDPLAKLYRWMEYASFGPMLEHCRFAFLPQCNNAKRALILGDGDGRFTARLLASNPDMHVDAVDASAAMLRELRRRVARSVPDSANRLRTFHADARSFIPPANDYDLIATHFFLDCLTEKEVASLVACILPHLTSQARWIISEFSVSARGGWKIPSRLMIRFLYLAFHWMTHLTVKRIPDYSCILEHFGFRLTSKNTFLGNLLTAELWGRKSA